MKALHAASKRPSMQPVLLIVTLLIAQALASGCEFVGLLSGIFVENVFFGNDNTFRYKT